MALRPLEPKLEALPQELMDAIVADLDARALARLVSCSKTLKERLEPALYNSKDSQDKAMAWGCRMGSHDTIRLAVSYGAPLDLIWDETSTIGMAAKKHRGDTMRYLVQQGARVLRADMIPYDRHILFNQLRRMVQQICSPHISSQESSSLLRLLYEDAIEEPDRKPRRDADNGFPLITLIMSKTGPPLDLIQRVLEDGADPSKPRAYNYRDNISPLSAAIIANSESAFRLLLQNGADIHGTPMNYLPRKGFQIPVFAAARTMAIAGHGRAMFKLCLENGADINSRLPIMFPYFDLKKPGETKFSNKQYTYTSPLLAFLDSIESFKANIIPNPAEELEWLFERGAKFPVNLQDETLDENHQWQNSQYLYYETIMSFGDDIRRPREWTTPLSAPLRWCRHRVAVPVGIDFLIDKWGLQKFTEPRFISIIRSIVRHGNARRHVARLLLKYDHNCASPGVRQWNIAPADDKAKLKLGRDIFTMILLEYPSQDDNLDDVLTIFIAGKGRQYQSCSPQKPSDSAYVTIRLLLKAGANINARIPGAGPHGPTVLHFLCCNIAEFEMKRDIATQDGKDDAPPWLAEKFFTFLVNNGADPTIPVGEERKSAIDVLLANVVEFRPTVAREYVQTIVNILKSGHEKFLERRKDNLVIR